MGRNLAPLVLAIWVAAPAVASESKMTLGWIEPVMLDPQLGLKLEAKLDTGADTSSLDARDIRRVRVANKGYVRFSVRHPETREWVSLRKPYVRRVRIKRHSGDYQRRNVVRMQICVGDHTRSIEVNLIDRGNFEYPMLLGRSALQGWATVDPANTRTVEPTCWMTPEEVPDDNAPNPPDIISSDIDSPDAATATAAESGDTDTAALPSVAVDPATLAKPAAVPVTADTNPTSAPAAALVTPGNADAVTAPDAAAAGIADAATNSAGAVPLNKSSPAATGSPGVSVIAEYINALRLERGDYRSKNPASATVVTSPDDTAKARSSPDQRDAGTASAPATLQAGFGSTKLREEANDTDVKANAEQALQLHPDTGDTATDARPQNPEKE